MPEFPKVPMNLVKPTSPVTGTVVSSEICTKGGMKSASFVRHIVIDIGGTPLEGSMFAGQSFGAIPPGIDASGTPHKVRLYSLSSPSWGEDGEGKLISTTLKRVLEVWKPQTDEEQDSNRNEMFFGVCSNHLSDLNVGDQAQISGPNGKRFLLPVDRNAHDYLFMATGTGIAPFRAMCMELFDHPDGPTTSEVHVLMGVPYATDLLYDELFQGYAQRFSNFHYHTAISRQERSDGSKGPYVQNLLEEQFETFASLLSSERGLCYMCGMIEMQFGLYKVLAERGLASAYMNVKDEIAVQPPTSWTREQMRRYIRPTDRLMVEVY